MNNSIIVLIPDLFLKRFIRWTRVSYCAFTIIYRGVTALSLLCWLAGLLVVSERVFTVCHYCTLRDLWGRVLSSFHPSGCDRMWLAVRNLPRYPSESLLSDIFLMSGFNALLLSFRHIRTLNLSVCSSQICHMTSGDLQ